MLTDILVSISIECFKHAYILFWFFLFFVGLLANLPLYKVRHYYIVKIFRCQASLRPRCEFPLVLCLCVVELQMPKMSSYVLRISEYKVLELLTAFLIGFSLSVGLRAGQKCTWVDFVHPYMLGILKQSNILLLIAASILTQFNSNTAYILCSPTYRHTTSLQVTAFFKLKKKMFRHLKCLIVKNKNFSLKNYLKNTLDAWKKLKNV